MVNCVESFALCKKFDIPSYPKILFFQGENCKIYAGALEEKGIVAYLKRQTFPIVSTISNQSELKDFQEVSDVAIVGHFLPGSEAFQSAFEDLATSFRDDYIFGKTEGDGFEHESGSATFITVYKKFDDPELVCNLTLNLEANKAILKSACRQLVAEFRPELKDDFCLLGLPLGYLFVDKKDDNIHLIEEVRTLAKKHRNKLQFGTADSSIFDEFADTLHLAKRWPSFAIWDPRTNGKFPLNEKNVPLHVALEPFVDNFVSVKLKPTVISAPIPDTQTSPVLEVVAYNYDDLVLNNEKDVFVEFYTPWCGPCKALLPAYEKLARMYADDEGVRNLITIAKIDTEANDVPEKDIRHFPTFKLFLAGEKDKPVTYSGNYTVEQWSKFIRENSMRIAD
ncbi:thioredoxin-domain-containing protein [Mollisia scopiformis]|uniref:Protein disulfide-isomerase n=1 Tax=Mollisia scopiformis TaxID=149040 RepID=A0A194X5V6_MOLSC|nr:thioredoxin-domain-containing protein [Mollisia scopiformis]KUJ15561.1 thioredoxin-domain-containing protein [Mollisia scopiformis]